MTTNRLLNRLAKIEALSSPQPYVVEMLPGESDLELELRIRAIGRPVVVAPATVSTEEWERLYGREADENVLVGQWPWMARHIREG
jgi:hypothetical protein